MGGSAGKTGFGGRKQIRFVFWAVWLALLLNVFYQGTRKEGYYIDELWSYGLANSYYMPFLQEQEGYLNHWHEGAFYKSYLTVGEGEAFSFGSVYDNQARDVHPPLYYFLLHLICSVFEGEFSKWFGLSINLLFFGGVLWLMLEIGGQMAGNRYGSLVAPILYGISGGGAATALYIRMYMMLAFWGLLFVWLTFSLMEEERHRPGLLAALAASAAAGLLTQYYFVPFAFLVTAGYLVFRLFRMQWRMAFSFGLSVLAGTGLGILIFPACLVQIFRGEKGQASLENAFRGGRVFLERLEQYGAIVGRELFYHEEGLKWAALGAVLAGAAAFLIRRYKGRPDSEAGAVYDARLGILTAALWGYFLLIVQISTDVADRYQFLIYPVGVLVLVTVFLRFFRQIKMGPAAGALAAGAVLAYLSRYGRAEIPYIYPGYEAARQALAAPYGDSPGIYVTAGDHLVINNCLFLAQQNMTYPIKEQDLAALPGICRGYEADRLILYVDIYFEEEQTAREVAELLGYSSWALLYDNTFTQIYCLSR